MAISNYKIDQVDIEREGVQGVTGDSLDGSSEENKKRFDQLSTFIVARYNEALDAIETTFARASESTDLKVRDAVTGLEGSIALLRTVLDGYKTSCDANAELTRQLGRRIDNEMTKATISYGTGLPDDSVGKDGDIYLQIKG